MGQASCQRTQQQTRMDLNCRPFGFLDNPRYPLTIPRSHGNILETEVIENDIKFYFHLFSVVVLIQKQGWVLLK